MSTRCQIQVEGNPVLFYKHSDGYPSGVLDVLLPLVADFFKLRGFDKEYLVAHICHAFIAAEWKNMAEDKFYKDNPNIVARSKYLGFGLDTEIHGDIEFLYTVKADGSVVVEGVTHSYATRARTAGQALGTFPLGTDVASAIDTCEGKASDD